MGFEDKYIHIPYPILRRKGLSDKAKMIYGLVQGFWDGDFHATANTISSIMGCSKRSVQRATAELVEAKLVFNKKVIEDGQTKGRILTIIKTKTV